MGESESAFSSPMLGCCSSKHKGSTTNGRVRDSLYLSTYFSLHPYLSATLSLPLSYSVCVCQKRRRALSNPSESSQRPGLRVATERDIERHIETVGDSAGPSPRSVSLCPALVATMSLSEELPSCPPPPSPAEAARETERLMSTEGERETDAETEDEISRMLACVTASKATSSACVLLCLFVCLCVRLCARASRLCAIVPSHWCRARSLSVVGSVDDVDLADLEGLLPGGDSELLREVHREPARQIEGLETSLCLSVPDSPFDLDRTEPARELGSLAKTIVTSSPAAAERQRGVEKGAAWEVFIDDVDTDGAVRNGSKILGLKEANQLLVWNSKLRDMRPVGLSTVRIEGVGAGRMPAVLELWAKGQPEPVAVEQVRTVRAFSVSSFTGLKVERALTDVEDASASTCDLRVSLRVGPYGGNLTAGGEAAKGSAQKLGCDRACCFLSTSEIGFTAAQHKSTLGEDEWLIPHAFSATSVRSCCHTLPASVRSVLQGKAAKLEDRQYPFYFVAALEDRTRVLVQGSFRMQSGSDERMVAMTQQKRRWRKDEVNAVASGKRQSLASLDGNELKQNQEQQRETQSAVSDTERSFQCTRCGQPKKQRASSCPCSSGDKTAASPHVMAKQRTPLRSTEGKAEGSARRPDYMFRCKHCSATKKQPRSLCPCNGTGLYPRAERDRERERGLSLSLCGSASASVELFQGTPEAAVAAATAERRTETDSDPIFRKMELDDITASQEDIVPFSEAGSLAEMEEPGWAHAIDMSDSSWNDLIPSDMEV